ncbi:MAG: extracellular solute-binding protein [Paenibacillaceae bacterium]|nr:extracellular solute-binding protein [Paenibacillaceae bacterium]
MMSKKVASTLAVILATAALYGCSGGNKNDSASSVSPSATGTAAAKSPSPSASQAPAKIVVMKPLFSSHVYYPDSELEKLVEKGAGVEVTYEVPPDTEYKSKLSVKIAGGDVPDIIQTYSPNDPEHNAFITQGLFRPLDDLLPKFPKLKDTFSDTTWDMLRNPADGKIYGVPLMKDRTGPGIVVRTDILKELGLATPKTLDELVTVLKEVKAKKKDLVPFVFTGNGINEIQTFFPLWGVNPGWYPEPKDPNKLAYGMIDPRAKEVVKFMRMLREEGLLDPDYLVGKVTGNEKYGAGKAAVIDINIGGARNFMRDFGAEVIDPITNGSNVWSLAYPALPISRVNQISAKSKNPEAALRYLEYEVTDGYDYIHWGVEGKNYTIQNGEKVVLPDDKKDPQYRTNVALELLAPEWVFSHTDKYSSFVGEKLAKLVMDRIAVYEQHIVYDHLRSNTLIPTLQEKSAQLKQVLDEGYSKMILDSKVDIDKSFDEMVAKWRSLGGDKVIEEVNTLQKDKSTPKYSYKKK